MAVGGGDRAPISQVCDEATIPVVRAGVVGWSNKLGAGSNAPLKLLCRGRIALMPVQ
jgi:hypothetical protein